MRKQRQSMAVASEAAGGAGRQGLTDSKEQLFSIGWHAEANSGIGPRAGTSHMGNVRSTAGFSKRTGESGVSGGRRVFYETRDGAFVRRAEYEKQRAEEQRREDFAKTSKRALMGIIDAVSTGDAKTYDAFVAYLAQKSRHFYRLQSGLLAGISLALVLLFVLTEAPTNPGFAERLQLVDSVVVSSEPAPPPATTANESTTAAARTTTPAVTTTTPAPTRLVPRGFASPHGNAACSLELTHCLILNMYANLYEPLGYLFLIASMLGVLFGLMPFAYEASMSAPHRSISKRIKLLERAMQDPTADPRTKAKAAQALEELKPLASRATTILRYFFNPAVVFSVASWACTVALMSVEHDRRRKAELVTIDASQFARVRVVVLVRAGINLLGLLLSLTTSGDPAITVER